MKKIIWVVLCALCLTESRVSAEGFTEVQFRALESQVQQLTSTVQNLTLIVEQQNRELETLKTSANVETSAVGHDESKTKIEEHGMPEISVVADMSLRLDSPTDDADGADRLSVREVDLIIGGEVDDWTHFDSTLAFSEEEGVELEEAYVTRFALPFGMTGRLGRLKPRIGKVLPVHRHSLDTVDVPLVIQRYFGHEGIAKTGVELGRVMDLPWAFMNELNFGVMEGGNGEEGTLFGETKRRPTLYTRLRNYLDVTDISNLEIGLTHMAGSRDADAEFEVLVIGIDGTFIHRFNADQNFKLQGEAYNANRTGSMFETLDNATRETIVNDLDGNIWGGYALADFRFRPKWSTGFRLDHVQIVDRPIDSPQHADIGYTGYLTFHQSEFARWRVQLSRFDLTDGSRDNQVLFQGTFVLGKHIHETR